MILIETMKSPAFRNDKCISYVLSPKSVQATVAWGGNTSGFFSWRIISLRDARKQCSLCSEHTKNSKSSAVSFARVRIIKNMSQWEYRVQQPIKSIKYARHINCSYFLTTLSPSEQHLHASRRNYSEFTHHKAVYGSKYDYERARGAAYKRRLFSVSSFGS